MAAFQLVAPKLRRNANADADANAHAAKQVDGGVQ